MTAAWKKLRFILSVRSDFYIIDICDMKIQITVNDDFSIYFKMSNDIFVKKKLFLGIIFMTFSVFGSFIWCMQ